MSPSDFDDDWGFVRGNADEPEYIDIDEDAIVNEIAWSFLMLEFC